jgi:hypothetical protein
MAFNAATHLGPEGSGRHGVHLDALTVERCPSGRQRKRRRCCNLVLPVDLEMYRRLIVYCGSWSTSWYASATSTRRSAPA